VLQGFDWPVADMTLEAVEGESLRVRGQRIAARGSLRPGGDRLAGHMPTFPRAAAHFTQRKGTNPPRGAPGCRPAELEMRHSS
jgi:hypothetical protein